MYKNYLNIAMLGHKRIPSREGGIEIVVEELSTRIVQQGNSVTCFNRRGHHIGGKEFDGQNLKEYKGIKLRSVLTINRKGCAAVTSSISAALQSGFGKFDVVHFHAEGSCAMLWLPKLFGKRCVATIHGIDWQREKWKGGFGSKYIKFGEKIAAKYADEIIVLSKSIQNYFNDVYKRKTHFIPNGVNRPKLLEPCLLRKQYGLEKNGYILYLGRLVPEKGEHYLIKAFKNIQTDKKLVIAGGSSDSNKYIEKLKQLAVGDERIIFTGFVQGRMLEELYSNAYIYVLPSDLEGMPLSLLEAMSYGNCCVVSDIAECTEVIEDKGVVFKKGDIQDLQEKLEILCNNGSIVQKYKSITSDFICEKYSWDRAVEKTLDLYRR